MQQPTSVEASLRAMITEAVADALKAQTPAVAPRLFTVEQAAQYLGRTEGAMRQLKRSGRIPVVQLDGRVFFDRADLDRVVDEAKR